MILAFARGFVLSDIAHFSAPDVIHALAEGDGGGGDGGGGDGGGGDGGGGDGGGGDGAPAGGDAGGPGPAAPVVPLNCVVSPANPKVGDVVTWSINPADVAAYVNSGNYVIDSYFGTSPVYSSNTHYGLFNGTNWAQHQTSITKTYSSPGTQYATLFITTDYQNTAATTEENCSVTVSAAPPVCILTVNPTSITAGQSTALAWGFSSGVTSISIDNGIGVKSSRSYTSVTPNTTTTYTGTVSGPGGSATCSATATVTPPPPVVGCMDKTATNYNPAATSQTGVTCTYPPAVVYGCMDKTATNYNPSATSQTGVTCTYPPAIPVPTCALAASPASVQTGSASSLSWTTTDATSFSITSGIGAVSPAASGSQSVTPSTTTTYTGTASGAGGTATCSATVTVTSTPPPPTAPTCTLSANPASVQAGTFTSLTWTTTNGGTFSIDQNVGAVTPAIGGSVNSHSMNAATTFTGTVVSPTGQVTTCTTSVTVTPVGGGAGGGPAVASSGGGSGGGALPPPTVTLAVLPHVGAQPLAYLYLSQIPYTGLDLGPVGTTLYWLALIAWALALAYLVLFGAAPIANRSLRNFSSRVLTALNARELAPATALHAQPAIREPHIVAPETVHETAPEAPRSYSSYDGFKSFAQGGALSIDDIVKGLSRRHVAAEHKAKPAAHVEPVFEHVEPVYDRVEPMYEHVETIAADVSAPAAPASVRGFIAALVEGDRAAVFAGLRQHVRGSGAPEQLITDIVCLLDDAYRTRVDGTVCDADIARLTARLSTPVLEKLITALATAVDASYSTGVTGAKLALTRALSVLGA